MSIVTELSNRVHGPVGALDVFTIDGRRIDPAGFRVSPSRPLPLLELGPDLGAVDGHAGQVVCGVLDRVTVADGIVHVEGRTALPPGTYPCGMDLRDVEGVLVRDDGSPVDAVGLARLVDDDDAKWVELVTAGTLIAVTAYRNGGAGAFPNAVLTVEAAR